MTAEEEAVLELERSPALPDHIARLQQVLEDEQRRRERFYEEIDEKARAEFINGKIIMHSPARLEHLKVSSFAMNLLTNFVWTHELGEVFIEKCMIQCRRNAYEPDICFFNATKAAAFVAGQKIFPPPDLIVEILSPSTKENDRTIKRRDYALHGVGEYWIVDADQQMIEQYILPAGAEVYDLEGRLSAGERLASHVLAGFAIPIAALFDARENQRALQALTGLA